MMREARYFILKLLVFCTPVILALTVYTAYYYYDAKYRYTVNGYEIYWSLNKSQQKKKVKKLLIGDSVGQQLFSTYHYNGDTLYSLASNQAISCIGFYIMVKNFVETNPDSLPGHVVLVINPTSLTNNLDQPYTYHYFLKPFNRRTYKPLFSPTVNAQISTLRFHYLSQFPYIKIINWSPTFTQPQKDPTELISPISYEYLARIKHLCDSLHVQLTLVSPPVSDFYRRSFQKNGPAALEKAKAYGIQDLVTPYLTGLIYMPDSLYRDRVHFYKPDEVDLGYIKGL